jgi:hypothetical protein
VALDEAKYVLFTVKIVEIIVGFSWVTGFGSGLAWLLMTPVWFHILAYHFLLNKKEWVMPVSLLVVHLLLGWKHAGFLEQVVRLGL